MRIAFIGTVEFSYNVLQLLIRENYEVVTVLTKSASEFNADFKDLTPLCKENGIPFKFVNDVNHINNVSYLASSKPDIIYCFGWSGLLKSEILNLAPKGAVGFHPAKLPFNRGRHPIIWALALGLTETASTFFKMDEGADTGDILSQESIDITYSDNALSLYNKIVAIALEQVTAITKGLIDNSIIPVKQDVLNGNNWRKRDKRDGEIDFRMSTRTIYNLVRSLSYPYVGAHISLSNGDDIKVWQVEEVVCNEVNLEYGKILEIIGNRIKVKCADGCIVLVKHDFEAYPEVGQYL